MNLRTKKNLIKACVVINILFIILLFAGYMFLFTRRDSLVNTVTNVVSMMGFEKPNITARLLMVVMYLMLFVILLHQVLITLYLVICVYKNKLQFYTKKTIIRLICVDLSYFLMGNFVCIGLLSIVCFWKDDKKQERKKVGKNKKGHQIAPCFLKEYKVLKNKKQHGEISKEYYDREFSKLVKKSNEFFRNQPNVEN